MSFKKTVNLAVIFGNQLNSHCNDVTGLFKVCMESMGCRLRSRVSTAMRPTENNSTWLYKNDDISAVIMCS